MSVKAKDSPELYARVQEQNLLRQYDLLLNCIEIGLEKGIEAFDRYTLWSLNAAAVANIAQFGGATERVRYTSGIIGRHTLRTFPTRWIGSFRLFMRIGIWWIVQHCSQRMRFDG